MFKICDTLRNVLDLLEVVWNMISFLFLIIKLMILQRLSLAIDNGERKRELLRGSVKVMASTLGE